VASSVTKVVSPGRSVSSVTEGDEPESFWAALGGKADYCSHAHGHAQADRPALPARLFHCVLTLAGKVRAFEIHDFEQKASLWLASSDRHPERTQESCWFNSV
jgi:hypothetical protein